MLFVITNLMIFLPMKNCLPSRTQNCKGMNHSGKSFVTKVSFNALSLVSENFLETQCGNCWNLLPPLFCKQKKIREIAGFSTNSYSIYAILSVSKFLVFPHWKKLFEAMQKLFAKTNTTIALHIIQKKVSFSRKCN